VTSQLAESQLAANAYMMGLGIGLGLGIGVRNRVRVRVRVRDRFRDGVRDRMLGFGELGRNQQKCDRNLTAGIAFSPVYRS